jgi:hypothetical protein
MHDLTLQRCHHHISREAVARCPHCKRFFCRECITEHEDQVLCAACLRAKPKLRVIRRYRADWLLGLAQFGIGLFILYVLFYYLAQILLLLPTSFHEGTLWQTGWWSHS